MTPLSASKLTKEVIMTIAPNQDSSTPPSERGEARQEFANKYYLTSETYLPTAILEDGTRVGVYPTEEK